MNVKVDISSVLSLDKRAEAKLGRVEATMEREVGDVAKRASRKHKYKDRTHKLTDNTKAEVEHMSGYDASVSLVADTPYAEFVRRRGLMSIDVAKSEAENAIGKAFADIAEAIADD